MEQQSSGPSPLPLRLGLAVFALSLAVRLAHFWFVRGTPLASDYVPDLAPYLFMADKFLAGEFLFRQPMVMSPGYPLFLLPVLRLFGPDVPLFVLQNALFDAGSSVLVAALAARLSPPELARGAALCAGALHALNGPLLFYALLPLGEGQAMFLLLAALLLLADAPQRRLASWLSGAMFGLAALLRPNIAPAALLAGLALAFAPGQTPRRMRTSAAARAAAGMILILLPFLAHNLATEGRATPFGFQGGFTFYSGNHPGASGVGDALPGMSNTPYVVILESRQEASRLAGRSLTLAGADAFWYASSVRQLAEQPAEALRLLGVKALLLVNNAGVDATADLKINRRFSPIPALLPLPFGLALALAAIGMASARKSPATAALLTAPAATALITVLFVVTPRYKTMTLALLTPVAGLGLAALFAGRGRHGWRALLPAALLLCLSLVPLDLLVRKPGQEGKELVRLATFHVHKGQAQDALRVLDEARGLGEDGAEPRRLRRLAEIMAGLSAPRP